MKTPTHHSIGVRLEVGVIAFFILVALSSLVHSQEYEPHLSLSEKVS